MIEKIKYFIIERYIKYHIKKDKNKFEDKYKDVENMPYFRESFLILKEMFPESTEAQRNRMFSTIQTLLHIKVFELTTNKSYVSYRDNGRFLKELRYLCEFIKSEQDTDEDRIKVEDKNG